MLSHSTWNNRDGCIYKNIMLLEEQHILASAGEIPRIINALWDLCAQVGKKEQGWVKASTGVSQQLWTLLIEHLPSSLLPWLSVWKVCISVCPWSSSEGDQEVGPRRNHIFRLKHAVAWNFTELNVQLFPSIHYKRHFKTMKGQDPDHTDTGWIQDHAFQEFRCVPLIQNAALEI